MTDRTLGAATVSSEGMAELGGAGTGGGGGAGVVTAVGAIPAQGLGGQVGGEEIGAVAGGPPPGLAAGPDVNGL
jgi:hypothetical protein